ncbi:MAG: hypothetical protein CMI06_10920 [Oceanospirillaceae bacterium]|jgi:NNP family nitrate/nitrite transporter-like MFS transporter|nr:hypothetical protein [Oceanospirillaceae bacterium]
MPNLTGWKPDDTDFWKNTGNRYVRHLPVLQLILLLAGSSVWMGWSVLSALMADSSWGFSPQELFSLIYIAGFSGAALRLCGRFLVFQLGTRAVIWSGIIGIWISLIAIFWVFKESDTPLWAFRIAAACCGFGAVVLPQITSINRYIYPRRMRFISQEMPIGLGDAGLILIMVMIPTIIYWNPPLKNIFTEYVLIHDSSNLIGVIHEGHGLWFQWLILPIAGMCLLAAWLNRFSPAVNIQNMMLIRSAGIFSWGRSWLLLLLVILASIGIPYLSNNSMITGAFPAVREMSIFIVIFLVIFAMQNLAGNQIFAEQQLKALANREVHILALMYLMGHGSFLGLSVSLPLLTDLIFSYIPTDGHTGSRINPAAPSILSYCWIGPLLGLSARAAGSWMSKHINPGKIHQVALFALFLSTVGMALTITSALSSPNPEFYFFRFYMITLLFFIASGMSSGSITSLAIKKIPANYADHSLIWIISISSFGFFYIPALFADHWQSAGPAAVLSGLSIFYLTGMIINWFFYWRKGEESLS